MKYFTLSFLILTLLAACSGNDRGCAGKTKPNVILLIIDTLRADHVQCYGYSRETTPTLDRLAAEGVRFDTAIAVSSWSAPSQISIITGANAIRHQVLAFGQAIKAGVSPLAVHLKNQGYSTGVFSTHLSLHRSVGRVTEGLDHQIILKNDRDRKALRKAAKWASKVKEPYFLYISLMTPHAPYNKYPPSYDDQYFTDMPPGGEKTFPFTDKDWVGENGIPRSVRLDNHNQAGYYVNRYDRGIRYVDDLIQQFWKTMENANRTANTLLIITSDHGEGLGDHGCFAHELYLYDFLVRVPLIMHYPERIPAGQVWPTQVSLLDIVPTVLGFVGCPIPESVDGKDLSPWLIRKAFPKTPRLLTGSYRLRGYDRYMVRSDQHKLIFDALARREELYDLAADPLELDNLMLKRDARFPESAYKTLREALQEYLARHSRIPLPDGSMPLNPEVMKELKALGYIEE